MKTQFFTLLCVCLGTIAPVLAQELATPQFQWVATLAGQKSLGMYENVAPSTDGNFFTASRFSLEDPCQADYFTFTNGVPSSEATFLVPSPKDNFGNYNGVIAKIDPEGHMVWSVYTNHGDVRSGGFSVAPMPDGGAMVAMKVIPNKVTPNDVLCSVVAPSGEESQLTFINPDPVKLGRIACPVMFRLNADGEVVWMKRFEVDLDTSVFPAMEEGKPKGGADFVNLRNVSTDGQGNAYIIGTYITKIDFGNNVQLPAARNVIDYDGNKGGMGDLFVAKIDPTGKALWAIHTSGDPIEQESGLEIEVDGDRLYIIASVTGDSLSTIHLGSFSCTPPTDRSLLIASLSTADASVQWAHFYASNHAIKPMHVDVNADRVYFSGSVMGDMIENGETILSTPKKNYRSFILAFDKLSGERQAAWNTPNEGISEVNSVYEFGDYVWASAHNFNSGQMYLYFEKDLSKGYEYFVKTQNNNELTMAGLLLDNQYVVLARYRQPAQLKDCDFVIPSVDLPGKEKFSCLLYSYQMPLNPSVGVEEVSATEDLQILASKGSLTLSSASTVDVQIYNLLGILVSGFQLDATTTTLSLPQGFYVVNGVKTMVY